MRKPVIIEVVSIGAAVLAAAAFVAEAAEADAERETELLRRLVPDTGFKDPDLANFPSLWEFVDFAVAGLEAGSVCCVCSLVLTTSNGHVNTPAIQPADAPVKISRGRPMSREPIHARASFCSCS